MIEDVARFRRVREVELMSMGCAGRSSCQNSVMAVVVARLAIFSHNLTADTLAEREEPSTQVRV